MVDSNILHKLRQLFAMAEHEASNKHEAAIALEKAQALLLAHNLSRASITTETTRAPTDTIGKVEVHEETGYPWRRQLLHVIATNNLCKTIGDTSAKTSHVFGAQDNVRSVLEMYYWVTEQLVKMARDELKAYKEKGGYEASRTFNAGFFHGAIKTIGDRLRKPMDTFRASTGQALVLANDAKLKVAIGHVFPHTVKSRSSYRVGDGYYHGKEAGNSVKFGRTASLQGAPKALGPGR